MIDTTEGRLDASLAFALSIGESSLQECIDRLKRDEDQYRCKPVARVFNDRLEHCFEFSLMDGEKLVLYGGITYHGKHGEISNFSVQMEPSGGWQIHT